MKCLVLAGGSSDRLWPLARREYPKQFLEIREGCSLFQEAILRNIPLCDEFIILTNRRYENIVKGQLQAFQGVRYRVLMEAESLKTAIPVIAVAKSCDEEETLLVVSTDCIIDGEYAGCVTQVKEIAARGGVGIIVCPPVDRRPGHHFINQHGKKISFSMKPGKVCFCDCGITAVKAGVLLGGLQKEFAAACDGLRIEDNTICSDRDLPSVSFSKVLDPARCELVRATFAWARITDISSFYDCVDRITRNNRNAISYHCKGVEIVNMVENHLIVANGLKNIVIVNTRDTVYVSEKSSEPDIKGIMRQHYTAKKHYFDVQPLKYLSWGTEEVVYTAERIDVSRITVFPNECYAYQCRRGCVGNFLILQGAARLKSSFDEIDFSVDQNIVISDCRSYKIVNTGRETLVLLYTFKRPKPRKKAEESNLLVRLSPVFKENLWGGTRLRDVFKKDEGGKGPIGESWELSAHPDGESTIADGEYAGFTFPDYIDAIGRERLGWKAQGYERFPLMIKFIDAKENLSIQVHPADEYALTVEGQYGKNEMWYVLDAAADACLYIGFKRDVTEEEVRRRIADDTLTEVLNRIPVKKGDTYFLEAGTVHAIGAGCLVCEVQQSSNITYRLYDYGRRDKDGALRELHVDKALDVLNLKKLVPRAHVQRKAVVEKNYVKTVIGECKYFTVTQYFLDGECMLPATDRSFYAVVVIEGSGIISDGKVTYSCDVGETYFAAAKESLLLKGNMKVLVTNI